MIQNATRAVIELRRLVRFGLTGVVATLTYAGCHSSLVEAGLTGAVAAAVVGYLASATGFLLRASAFFIPRRSRIIANFSGASQ